jgi:hypothetical protein
MSCYLLYFQQQSKTYQSQIGRRRNLQDSAEETLHTRISQLEANVERSTSTIVAQVECVVYWHLSLFYFTSMFRDCYVGAAIFVMSGSDVLSLYCVMCVPSCL